MRQITIERNEGAFSFFSIVICHRWWRKTQQFNNLIPMLINLSNHPSEKWNTEQTNASIALFGHTEDLPFPQVNPAADFDEIQEMAQHCFDECMQMFADFEAHNPERDKPNAVHLMGEFTLVYVLTNLFRNRGIQCVASTTQRNVLEEKDGKKTLIFNFVQFRPYF